MIIELEYTVTNKRSHSGRHSWLSAKPWEKGRRFILRRWGASGTWEIGPVKSEKGHYDVGDIDQHDPRFMDILIAAEPVTDTRAILSTYEAHYIDARAILIALAKSGIVTDDQIREAGDKLRNQEEQP
jgi:hypothetical protein